jgi:hypothetical protein
MDSGQFPEQKFQVPGGLGCYFCSILLSQEAPKSAQNTGVAAKHCWGANGLFIDAGGQTQGLALAECSPLSYTASPKLRAYMEV